MPANSYANLFPPTTRRIDGVRAMYMWDTLEDAKRCNILDAFADADFDLDEARKDYLAALRELDTNPLAQHILLAVCGGHMLNAEQRAAWEESRDSASS